MPEPLRLALSIVGIFVILIAAYYTTYYISVKASGQSRGKGKGRVRGRGRGRHISLLERFAISKDKSFCIVEIAGKVYIIGVTNQSMTLLDTVSAEDFAQPEAEGNRASAQNVNPGGIYNNKLVKRLSAFIAYKTGRTPESSDAENGSFESNLKSAHDKDTSGQSDRKDAGRPRGSEGEE